MIDLHSHVLPGIDDGASTLDDSIILISDAIKSGVTKILATPHIHFGTFDNNLHSIQSAFSQLTEQLKTQQIDVSLAYAAEVRICPEIMMLVKQNKLPFMGKWQGEDLLLLEFPHSHIPPGSEKLIDWLNKHNIRTMIAHPERNRELWQFNDLLRPFIERDCLIQITASSLLGDFGERSEKLAWQLVENKNVTIVASDMHNMTRRPCKMEQAYQAVNVRYGNEIAEKLFTINPDKIFQSNPTQWNLS